MLKRILHIAIICLLSITVLGQYPYNYSSNERLWKDGSKIYISVTDPIEDHLISNASVVLWQNDTIVKGGIYNDSLGAYVIDTIVYGKFKIECNHKDYLVQTRKSYIPVEYKKGYFFLIKRYNLNQYHFRLGTKEHSFTYCQHQPFIPDSSVIAIQVRWYNPMIDFKRNGRDLGGFDKSRIEMLEKNFSKLDDSLKLEYSKYFARAYPKFERLIQIMDSLDLEWRDNGFNKYIVRKDGFPFDQYNSPALMVLRNDTLIGAICGPLINKKNLILHNRFSVNIMPNTDSLHIEKIASKYDLRIMNIEKIKSHKKIVNFEAVPGIGYYLNDKISEIVNNETEVLSASAKCWHLWVYKPY